MKILFFCPTWGMENIPLDKAFQQIKEAGYDGVEMAIHPVTHDFALIRSLLHHWDLLLVAQQPFATGATSEMHLQEYRMHLTKIAGLSPLFINSHTGKDYYPVETNLKFIDEGLAIERDTGVKIVHEIHRGRFTFCTALMQAYFERNQHFEITADFSHWCNVSESYLQDQPQILRQAIARSAHIHARVGHPEGPQVSHPGAPEWKEALDHHLSWWDGIVTEHQLKGSETVTITNEFGPPPYMPTLPFTREPVASQWEVNLFMRELLRERYTTKCYGIAV